MKGTVVEAEKRQSDRFGIFIPWMSEGVVGLRGHEDSGRSGDEMLCSITCLRMSGKSGLPIPSSSATHSGISRGNESEIESVF